MQLKLDAGQLERYLQEVFPQIYGRNPIYRIEAVGAGYAQVSLTAGQEQLRPGGTVSGPALMALADLAAYAVILAHVGRQALAVTTSLNINFMRKAEAGLIDGNCRLLKLGRQLAVVDCMLIERSSGQLIAQASATYALPPVATAVP
ncbi:PaaI family thioesterase [Polycladidibacter hongkongensis]|uniref:PaaI family thioesterase n=1 Tax=Polycladidibacter hongkongensis TaxID=1647556 RepID=UPI00083668E1|nr:PaaI family thioesterase [Pseudovibrio hongkongensis]